MLAFRAEGGNSWKLLGLDRARKDNVVAKNSLKDNQKMRLLDWVRSNLDDIKRGLWSQADTADRASKALGFDITADNLANILGSRERSFIKHEWPQTRAVRQGVMANAQLDIVVRAVEELRLSLGVTFQGELDLLWTRLVDEGVVE